MNKHNEHFVANQGSPDDAENASKLGLEQLAEYITEQGVNQLGTREGRWVVSSEVI